MLCVQVLNKGSYVVVSILAERTLQRLPGAASSVLPGGIALCVHNFVALNEIVPLNEVQDRERQGVVLGHVTGMVAEYVEDVFDDDGVVRTRRQRLQT